jgi:transcriptional regulator with XRE-family HTH domain
MARKLGISPAYLSDIEKGKRGLKIELFEKMKESGYSSEFLKTFEVQTVKRKE